MTTPQRINNVRHSNINSTRFRVSMRKITSRKILREINCLNYLSTDFWFAAYDKRHITLHATATTTTPHGNTPTTERTNLAWCVMDSTNCLLDFDFWRFWQSTHTDAHPDIGLMNGILFIVSPCARCHLRCKRCNLWNSLRKFFVCVDQPCHHWYYKCLMVVVTFQNEQSTRFACRECSLLVNASSATWQRLQPKWMCERCAGF